VHGDDGARGGIRGGQAQARRDLGNPGVEPVTSKPVSLRHAASLLWLAIALHAGSSSLALLGLLGADNMWRWLLVDGMAIVALVFVMRSFYAGSRWARLLLVP